MLKVAVVLSGCGYLDGAEIREAVLSLLYLDAAGASVQCFAPDKPQYHTVNHLTGDAGQAPRHCLEEAARIARGAVMPLNALDATAFDALVIPGGYGVAKNLSNIAIADGEPLVVDEDMSRVIHAFYQAKKTIVAICIAPAMVAVALANQGLRLSIGTDEATARLITSYGHQHVQSHADEAVIDHVSGIICTPAYMCTAPISQIANGIQRAIDTMIERCQKVTH